MLLRSLALASAGLLLAAVPASAASYTVAARDDYFKPRLITVSKGDRITWVNRGSSAHTVTTRAFSRRLDPGESYSRRIYRGFRYHCRFHGDMTGRIACRNC